MDWIRRRLDDLVTRFAYGFGAVVGLWVAAMLLSWLGYWPCAN